ncbi:MAG: hypothetical protein RIF32_03360 [Leptospirales bacterium]|jgi:hypothetical protein
MSQSESSKSESIPATDGGAPRTLAGVAGFWARHAFGAMLAPLLLLAGIGLEDASEPGLPGHAGPMLFVWCIVSLIGIAGLRFLLEPGHRGRPAADSKDLALSHRSGRVLFLALQLFFLTLLVPVGPGGTVYWAAAVGVSYGLLTVLGAPAYWNPATAVLACLSLATILWPTEIFSQVSATASSRACVPAGLNLYGGCLAAELAPAAIALQVVVLLLLQFRRHAPALVVLLGLGGLLAALGANGPRLESLLTLSAVVLFFPGQPYRSAVRQIARGALWGGGTGLFLVLLAPAADSVFAGADPGLLYPAWLAGLVFSEALALLLASVPTRRRRDPGPHL